MFISGNQKYKKETEHIETDTMEQNQKPRKTDAYTVN